MLIVGLGCSISCIIFFPRTFTPLNSYPGSLGNTITAILYLDATRNADAAVICPGKDARWHPVLGGEPCPRLCTCYCNWQGTRRNVSLIIDRALRALTVYNLRVGLKLLSSPAQAFCRSIPRLINQFKRTAEVSELVFAIKAQANEQRPGG